MDYIYCLSEAGRLINYLFYGYTSLLSKGSGALLLRLYKDVGCTCTCKWVLTYQFLKGSKITFTASIYLISVRDYSLSESKVLGFSLTCYKWFLDIGTMTIESALHPFLMSDVLHTLRKINHVLFLNFFFGSWMVFVSKFCSMYMLATYD